MTGSAKRRMPVFRCPVEAVVRAREAAPGNRARLADKRPPRSGDAQRRPNVQRHPERAESAIG